MNDYVKNLKYDIPAVAIVFLVTFPLCLMIDLALFIKGKAVLFSGMINSIVVINLLVGVGLGLIVAICFILYQHYKKSFLFDGSQSCREEGIDLECTEDVTFINKASIQHILTGISDEFKVVNDASKILMLGDELIEMINEFMEGVSFGNIEVEVIRLSFPHGKNQDKESARALVENPK